MELEPFPLERNDPFWDEGTPQWLERFEYIESRSERWLDYFRDNPEYDFTRTLGDVQRQQKATLISYESYASGKLTLLGVQLQVKMLRDAFKRKEATKPTPEERAAAVPAYVPKWRKDWEAKKAGQREQARIEALASQPSQDQIGFITKRGYPGVSPESSPMPGLNCYSVNHDEGYLETGERVDKGKAYLCVLWDRHEHFYPDSKETRPESFIPGYVKPKAEGETGERQTLDDLKKAQKDKAHKEDLERLDKRIKRGAAKR